jgi:stage VI sporulation protein D
MAMAMENGSPVRFHLEEHVKLKEKIRETDIISLDVEPEVEVIEQDQLVMIKGDLVLSGHFQLPDTQRNGEEQDRTDQMHAPPFQGEEEEQDRQSVWSVTERFPIDITVPAHKVSRLDDVYISVEQLDYIIDDHDRLTIEVEIALLGVENGIKIDRDWVEQNEGEGQAEAAQEEENDSAPEKEMSLDQETSADQDHRLSENRAGPPMEEEGSFEQRSSTSWSEDEQTPEQNQISNEGPEVHFRESVSDAYAEEETSPIDSENREEAAQEKVESSAQEEDESSDQQESSKLSQKVVSFLSKLMAVKEQEAPQKATLKLCIVQKNETLEQIAERYQVSIDEIIRFNRLPSEQISPGDIMYIPQKKKSGPI